MAINKAISEDVSLGSGFCIGHSYVCGLTAQNIGQLAHIVDYDIIPMLREYWFDNHDTVDDWSNKLRKAVNGQ
jgi:hypothetical protein